MRDSGFIVKLADGRIARTKYSTAPKRADGKVPVYLKKADDTYEANAIWVDPKTARTIGFIN